MNPGKAVDEPTVAAHTCSGCGGAVEPHETVLIRTADETLHVSALASLRPDWLQSVVTVWHAACFTDDRR
jgi:hypothetical protein